MASAGARPYNEGPGSEPLMGVREAAKPPEAGGTLIPEDTFFALSCTL